MSVTPTGATIAPTEGTAFTGPVASFTSSDAGPFTATVDWGDGTTDSGTIVDNGGGNFSVTGTHTYDDEGTEALTLVISDAFDSSTITFASSAVVAEADVLTPTGMTISSTEQSTFSGAVATFSDSYSGSVATDFSATIDWGDGATTAGTVAGGSGAFTVSGDHAYAEDGSYAMSVVLAESPPGSASATASSTANVPEGFFILSSGGPINATEGVAVAGFQVATFQDPGSPDTASDFSATIAWGDGVTTAGTVSGSGGNFTVTGDHTYADELVGGTYLVTVVETEAAFTIGPVGSSVNVAEGDSLTAPANASGSGAENDPSFQVTIPFTNTNASALASDFTGTINWGDGTITSGTVSGSGTALTVSGTHAYADEGVFIIHVVLADDAPGTASATFTGTGTVIESDVLVPATTPETLSGIESSTLSGNVAIFTDAAYPTNLPSDFTATIDWGDGTITAGGVTGTGDGTFTVSGSHAYAEDGSYTITTSLSDDPPGTASATTTATANILEAVLSMTGTAIAATEGQTFSGVVATASDPGSPDPASEFTASIDWGDGTTTAGTITGAAGNYTISGDHVYADEGSANAVVTFYENNDPGFPIDITDSATIAEADVLAPVTVTSGTVPENAPLGGVAAIFFDSGYPTNDPADFTATFDWGDGTTFSTGDGDVTVTSDGAGNFTLSVSAHSYADEGDYVVLATLADDAPGTASLSQTGTLTAAEADAFTPAATPATLTGTEGVTLSGVVAIFSDTGYPNNDPADFTATIDWGDGTTDAGSVDTAGDGSFTVSGSHAYADDGVYSLTATIADDSPGTASATTSATANIAEADMTLTSSVGALSATEGAAVSGVVATISDPGSTDPAGDFTALIDWGDGSTTAGTVTGSAGSYTIAGGHTYSEEGTYTVSVSAVETSASPAATATTSGSLVVADAPLAASGATIAPTEGASTTVVVASFTDADPNGTASDYNATIAWGDGTTTTGAIAANGGGGFNVTGTHAYLEEGDNALVVVISDVGGSTATAHSTAHVADAPLTATAIAITSPEFVTFSGGVASFTDADPNGTASDYTATIDWGDGTTTAGTVAANGSGGFNVTGSHLYAEDGLHTLSVTVVDAGGSTATASAAATITEPSISLSATSINGHERSTLNGVTVATFEHGDGGEPASGFTVSIDWGDGTTSAGTVSETSGKYTVAGSHLYLDEGSFTVSVRVSDDTTSATASAVAKMSEELLPNGTVGTPNERFIAEIYRDLLHRQIDASALPFWSAMLDHGQTRLQVVQAIIKVSAPLELNADLVSGIYQKYLGRDADAGGLAFWTGQLNDGNTIEQVEAGIVSTEEFFVKAGGTNDAYLEKLFQLALGRDLDAPSKAHFDAAFAGGLTREEAADFVFLSHEYRVDLVKGYYQSSFDANERTASSPPFIDDLDFLDRPADASGLNALVSDLDHGATDQQLWAIFLASDEFFNKTA